MSNNSKHFSRAAIGATAVVLAAAAAPVFAERFVDWAPVLSSTPVYQRVSQPRQECWTESVTTNETRRNPDVPVGAIAGGVAGGVIGHQIGSGRGNDVATVAGAIAGTLLGNNLDQNRATTTTAPVTRDVQRCRTVQSYADVVQGFDVRYQYNGREYVTRLPYDPGERIRLHVSVAVDVAPPPPPGPPPPGPPPQPR